MLQILFWCPGIHETYSFLIRYFLFIRSFLCSESLSEIEFDLFSYQNEWWYSKMTLRGHLKMLFNLLTHTFNASVTVTFFLISSPMSSEMNSCVCKGIWLWWCQCYTTPLTAPPKGFQSWLQQFGSLLLQSPAPFCLDSTLQVSFCIVFLQLNWWGLTQKRVIAVLIQGKIMLSKIKMHANNHMTMYS